MNYETRRTLSSHKLFAILQIMLFLSSSVLYAQLNSLQTKNLRLIYYTKAHEYIVPHLARCFENALNFHSNLFNYTPSEKVTVLLQDFGDYGNAGAKPLPNNLIHVGIAPFSYAFGTMPSNERMNWMMNHELVHIVVGDKAAGADNFFRSLFLGKVAPTAENPMSILYSYLTTPRWYSPRWYHEGIAVFLETWMAGGLGRALSAYDEMVFRTMVRDRSYIYDVVGLESEGTTIDFQVGANSYLYGTRFMSYLSNQYGPEKLLKWVSREPGSKRYFAAQFKHVYGVSLDEEWSRWIAWEHQWQQANLDSIRLHPTTPFLPISRRALGSVSRAYYDSAERKIYAAINYPGQIAHIASIDIESGAIEKLCNIKGSAIYDVASLAYDRSSGTLFYTTDNNRWRDLNALDIKTRKSKRLIKNARTGDLAFNEADKSIWGVRHFNGISTLVRIPYPYKKWNQIYTFPYGRDIFDIDISPDGSTITAALVEVSGRQKLIKMHVEKLLNGDAANDEPPYEVIFDFENSSPAGFVFSQDGKHLYGSSYYSGVSNIYRYDFETDAMEILSNCETGLFRPVPISSVGLIAFRYTGKGFVPVAVPIQPPEHVSAIRFLGNEIAKNHPIVKSWTLKSPALINIDSLTTSSGNYSTIRNIELTSAYPIVEGFKDFAAVGIRLDFSDRLGLSGFDITTSYSPDTDLPEEERIHVGINLQHLQLKLMATYNGADFYDLFGPTKTSRRGYSVGLQYKKTLLYDQPKAMDLSLRISGYGNLETLPDFQNVVATFDKLLSINLKLNYQYQQSSLGAVDYDKGLKWQIITHNNFVNKKNFPRIYTNFDYGIPLPINYTSIWVRTSVGYSFGDRDDPFANFFFGGFGNNWADYLSIKRYREYYSFPGVELNAIGAKNYGKVILEWNLPPIRFRRFGFPALYFNWTRISVFSMGIRTNFDRKEGSRTLINLGGQLDFRLVLFSHFRSTFSLGYAFAFERDESVSKELMISLKIL